VHSSLPLSVLLNALDPDTDRAVHLYRSLQQRIARFLRINNASDPESLADEVIDRLANRLITTDSNDIGSPQAFALGIARNVLHEDHRKQRREERAATEWATFTLANQGHDEDLLRDLDQCMSMMRDDQRRLLQTYYQWSGREKIEHHRLLSEQLGLTLNALRNRLLRARTELDKCIHKRRGDVFGPNNTKGEEVRHSANRPPNRSK
jgi:DNA-directed RNA polymerase specialized sigma24 family protein